MKGSALIITVILSLVAAVLVSVGAQFIATSFKETKHKQSLISEAENVARAGLVDTISWFRRQSNQPVCSGVPPTFYGWVDGAFDPVIASNDTIDASIGLVKEYQLSENDLKWCRYEVKRQTNPATAPYDPQAVHDITGERLHTGEQNGEGIVWYVESTGYVYARRDSSVAFNIAPNKVIAKSRMSTEIIKIPLELPAECAYIVRDGGTAGNPTVKIDRNGKIIGGNNIACGRSFGVEPSTVSLICYISGNPKYQTGLNDPTPNYVFCVSTPMLKAISDFAVTSINQLPNPLPDMSLVYIDGDAVFNSTNRLQTAGILFINGNFTISADSNFLYNGLIYVTGTATIEVGADISGCLIGYKGLTLGRSTAIQQSARLVYDSNILARVRQQICRYREINSSRRVTSMAGL